MKNNTQPNFCFSAYPLKATNHPAAETNLKINIIKKINGSAKVLPIPKPNQIKNALTGLPEADSIQNIKEFDINWFNNYE